MSGVVSQGAEDFFRDHIRSIQEAQSIDDFLSRSENLIRHFPRAESWFRWWMREDHASMLFTAHRKMDAHVWDNIPDTTNAEEAMHWKMYSALGRNHNLAEGLYSLFRMAEYFHRIHTAHISKI